MNLDQPQTLALALGIIAFLMDWFFFRSRATNIIQEKDKLDVAIYNNRVLRNLLHSTFIALLAAFATFLMFKSGIFQKFKLHFTFDDGTELIITIIALMFTVFVFVITHTFKQLIDEANRILATAEKQEKKVIEFSNNQEPRILQSLAFHECSTEHLKNIVDYAQGYEEAHKKLHSYAQFLEFLKIDFKDEFRIKRKLMEISKNTSEASREILQLPELKKFLEKLLENDNYSDETKEILNTLMH